MSGRVFGLALVGVMVGFVALVAGVFGLALAVIAAAGAYFATPITYRARSAAILLVSASLTVAILLGKVVLIDAQDPAIGLPPGTREEFWGAIALLAIGVIAAVRTRGAASSAPRA